MASILLVVHPERPAAWQLAADARSWWEQQGREVIELRQAQDGASLVVSEDLEFAVSLGGDGTMLRTVDVVLAAGVPVLGVNLGRMGYLTTVEPSGIEPAFERMLVGDFLVEERMALEVEISGSITGASTPRSTTPSSRGPSPAIPCTWPSTSPAGPFSPTSPTGYSWRPRRARRPTTFLPGDRSSRPICRP